MIIKRFEDNPILKPDKNRSWEAEAVFNGCPIIKGNKTFLLYRALSLPQYHTVARTTMKISSIGITESVDGLAFNNRKRFIVPEHEWERFGCEDPRVTKLNNKYYIFYTALGSWPLKADSIRVGVAISKDLKNIEKKHLVTPFNAKAMTLFPEKINGKMWAVLTVNTDRPPAKICLASFAKEENMWQESYWQEWYKNLDKSTLSLQRDSQDHVEVGAPPIKTKYGWLLFYSYIRNYFSSQRHFSIEAVLLDLKNPSKIIGRTDFPVLSPEEYYEKYGLVQNVVFPSGALLKKNIIYLYYGAADMTCAVAMIDLPSFVNKFVQKEINFAKLSRAKENPIIAPITHHSWEAKATFNPAAIFIKDKVHILYRAMSEDNTSVLGYATSQDGTKIDYRADKPAYVPRESFEQKLVPGGNSGAEDPRLIKIGNKIYMFYTAFDGRNPPRVAFTWIKEGDFLNQKWNWSKPVLISSPDSDDKNAAVFPEKIKGEYIVVHRNGNDIDLSFHKTLDFDGGKWLEEYRWIMPRAGWWDSKKVGIAAPPIKTADGWVVLYHGVSETDRMYRVGAVLADLRDPQKIIGRTDYPILEPEIAYEKEGVIPNVVFPCGAVVIDDKLFVYYGGADKTVGVASIKMEDLLHALKLCKY